MKKIIFCYLIFCSCSRNFVPGTYDTYSHKKIAFAGEEYIFYKDGTFQVENFTDAANQNEGFSTYGKGNYFVENESLNLAYTIVEDSVKTLLQKTKIPCTNRDSMTFYFNVKTPDNKPLIGVTITYETAEGTKGTVTDGVGEAKIKIKKSAPPPVYSISYLGYDELKIKSEMDVCMKYNIAYAERRNYVAAETQKKLLYKLKGKKLLLKEINHNHWRTFYRNN